MSAKKEPGGFCSWEKLLPGVFSCLNIFQRVWGTMCMCQKHARALKDWNKNPGGCKWWKKLPEGESVQVIDKKNLRSVYK